MTNAEIATKTLEETGAIMLRPGHEEHIQGREIVLETVKFQLDVFGLLSKVEELGTLVLMRSPEESFAFWVEHFNAPETWPLLPSVSHYLTHITRDVHDGTLLPQGVVELFMRLQYTDEYRAYKVWRAEALDASFSMEDTDEPSGTADGDETAGTEA